MNDVKKRYLTDAVFHTVVNEMRQLLRGAHLTPSEVREAAMLACIIEKERQPFRVSMSDEEMELMRQRLK